MKHLVLIFLLLAALSGGLLTSCIEDDFSSSPNDVLTFSTDTVRFDTVFTDIGTSTRIFKVYNRSKKSLNISSIKLADAGNSGFFMNVDGFSGKELSDIEIRGKDSLFIYVGANINPTDRNNPILIRDSIVFMTNGVRQDVKLMAYGQDVIIKRGETITGNTVLNAERPYLIYDSLVVAPNAELQLSPGATLHFHDKAKFIVQGRLISEGTREKTVTLRGDRLDRLFSNLPYDWTPGQWDGIYFKEESYGNRMIYTSVRGTTNGIQLDSCDTDRMKLEIGNSVIRNATKNLFTGTECQTYSWNSEFSNAGGSVVALIGGKHEFTHCTIVNYNIFSVILSPIVSMSRLIPEDGAPAETQWLKASFNNCIVTGNTSEIDPGDLTGTEIHLNNCLLRANGSDDANFMNTVWTGKPYFIATGDDYIFDFRIASDKSDAIGKGNPLYCKPPLDTDMYGNSRFSSVDIGAYQYLPGEEKE